MDSAILKVADVSKSFNMPHGEVKVLNEISFSVESGESVSIVGPSGSGKSTLLGICAGLDLPDSGVLKVDGISLTDLDEDGRAEVRIAKIGFVFQFFQLIPTLTALENVMVPLELSNSQRLARAESRSLLERIGLGDRLHHYPIQLSGGEQQRVGLARAFINQPKILFADEPTGNLDHDSGLKIADLLFELNKKFGTTLITVTHNVELANRANRRITLSNGMIKG